MSRRFAADKLIMIPEKSQFKQSNNFDNSQVLIEGADFHFQLEGSGKLHYFSIVLVQERNTFIACAHGLTQPTSFIVGEELVAEFPTEEGACSVKIRITGQSENSSYISFAQVDRLTFEQKRETPRLRPDESVGFRIQFESIGNIYRGVTIEDISAGGIGVLVRSSREVEKGTRARLFIELPRHDLITIYGEVMNCARSESSPRLYRIGLRFIKANPIDLKLISEYVRHNMSHRKPK